MAVGTGTDRVEAGAQVLDHEGAVQQRHADRVAVMYGGRVVEQGELDAVFKETRHPYTVSLFRSIPQLHTSADEELTPIDGQPPNPAELPPGCAFEARCYLGRGRADCLTAIPKLTQTDRETHLAACHYWQELAGKRVGT